MLFFRFEQRELPITMSGNSPINDFVGSQGILPAFQILRTYSQYRILETMYNTLLKKESFSEFDSRRCVVNTSIVNIGFVKHDTYLYYC